jgi:proton-dependent oligopeptide transporter, POT family
MTSEKMKQPPVFNLAFFTTMCERFGFYVLSFVLVLYAKSEFSFTDNQAFALYAIFTALAYLSTAMGGYLADNVIGIRRCLIMGLLFESAGLLLLMSTSHSTFPIALALLIIGVGLFKTAPTHLLGRSYKENDPRIDSGFTLFYMSINIGTLVSSLLMGSIQRYYGWGATFLLGGLGILLGLLVYIFLKGSAKECDSKAGQRKLPLSKWLYFFIGIVAAIAAFSYFIWHAFVAYGFYIIAGVCVLSYFAYEIARSSKEDKLKIIACLSLILMGLIFYTLYQQAYTSIVLFINRSVERHMFGVEIPTIAYFSLNAVWVVILGPILAWLYNYLGKKGKDLSVTLKFPIGLLVTTLCFFSLNIGAFFANGFGMVSSGWVVLAYFFYTLGEMLVGALGVAMVTHIAPKRMYGIMMGSWFFFGMSLSAILSGKLADIASIPDTLQDQLQILSIYNHAFFKIGIISLVFVVLSFIAGPFIKKMAKLD